jgi:hypothetical protein
LPDISADKRWLATQLNHLPRPAEPLLALLADQRGRAGTLCMMAPETLVGTMAVEVARMQDINFLSFRVVTHVGLF